MEEIKKRAVRRKKIIPPYSYLETRKEVKVLPIYRTGSTYIILYSNLVCPHTNLIPVSYLTNSILNGTVPYIKYDEIEHIKHSGTITMSQFSGDRISKIRNKSLFTGLYTAIHNEKIVALSVILPENYFYQKLHILKHGTVDLSRVIILIDRVIDDTSKRGSRMLYNNNISTNLLLSAAQVWKVPNEFIMDNCFMAPYQRPSIEELDKEKEIVKEAIVKLINPQASKPQGITEVIRESNGIIIDEDLPW